jgi:hypothetical protein
MGAKMEKAEKENSANASGVFLHPTSGADGFARKVY